MNKSPALSILITHYNRPESLKKSIQALRILNFPVKYEIVVSDDGSKEEYLQLIQNFPIDTLLTVDKNSGLANNLNRGISACKGIYILYVQEDYVADIKLGAILDECMNLLRNGSLDMIRLKANYRFKKLIPISDRIFRIPRFHFQNFTHNLFMYSDNPFITRRNFFDTFGFYLSNTSGHYGETEFAMRILKLRAKVGISRKYYFSTDDKAVSVLNFTENKRSNIGLKKKIHQFMRAIKLYIVYFSYDPGKRKLIFFRNNYKP